MCLCVLSLCLSTSLTHRYIVKNRHIEKNISATIFLIEKNGIFHLYFTILFLKKPYFFLILTLVTWKMQPIILTLFPY